jgi:hypothetical protein
MLSSRTGVEPMSVMELQPMRRQVRSIVLHAVTGALTYQLVGLLAPAVFITAGLRNGWRGFLGALAGASLIIGSFAAVLPSTFQKAEIADAVRLVLEVGLASGVALALVRRRSSGGKVVLAALGASAVGFVASELVMRAAADFSIYSTILGELQRMSGEFLKELQSKGSTAHDLELWKRGFQAVSGRFAPAVLLCTTALSFVASLTVVPRVAYDVPGSEVYLFRRFALPEWLLVVFVVVGLSPALQEPFRTIGFNALAVVVFLYVLQALAIYRSVLARLPIGLFGLIAAFAFIFLLMGAVLPLALLALAGLFDPFFDFRNLHRKEQSDESDSD